MRIHNLLTLADHGVGKTLAETDEKAEESKRPQHQPVQTSAACGDVRLHRHCAQQPTSLYARVSGQQ